MSNKIARSINGVTESYSYDALYRLETFDYDDVGNREDNGYTTGAPGSNSQKMNRYAETPVGVTSHDINGNLTGINTNQKSLSYDYRNQMVSFSDGTNVTDYKYDALGRRISKSNNTGETRYYSLGSRVIEETTATNNTSASYVYGNYIDEVLSMNRSNNNYFYHADDIYNVMMLSNAAGGMAEDYDYDAFGAPDNISNVGNPYLFNGREYDTESGFYNYRTRYLDPSVGRFTTRDTIGIWGDPSNLGNGYTYVGNNPHTFVDPHGEALLETGVAVVTTVYGAATLGTFVYDLTTSAVPTALANFIEGRPITENVSFESSKWLYKHTTGAVAEYVSNESKIFLYNLKSNLRADIDVESAGDAIESGVETAISFLEIKNAIKNYNSARNVKNCPINPQKFLIGRVKPPKNHNPGSANFGNAMHKSIADMFEEEFPGINFIMRVRTGQKGVDIEIPRPEQQAILGFKYAEIKPNKSWQVRRFENQVEKWKEKGHVKGNVIPITYDYDGNVYIGFE